MKIRNLLILILLSAISYPSVSQPTTWAWAEGLGGKNNYDGSNDLTRDAAGNIYIVGEFSGTKNFGVYTLFATGFSEVFVAKFDPTGVCQWAVKAGANFSSAYAGGIAISGNQLYVLGYFSNNINFGGNLEASTGLNDIFLAQLDPASGTCNWLKKAGGTFDDYGVGITAENNGGIFITGNFVNQATFGTFTMNTGSVINADIFLCKYDAAGTCIWAVKAGGATTDKGYAVEQLPGGSIFLTGYYQGTATFGTSTTITSVFNYDFFLARYDGSGNLSWVQSGGGKGNDIGYGISNDSQGNIYVTGFIGDTASFGSINVFDNEYGSIIVAKYTNGGIPVWVKTAGGFIDDAGYDISTDAVGSSYVTGHINGNANFSGTPVTGVTANDGFAAKYDANGLLKWVTKVGGTGFDRGKAIIADISGFCYVAGDYTGTVTLGSFSITSPPGEWGTYIAKLGGGTVGINEIKDAPFSFYPNPANQSVIVNLSKVTDVVFTLDIYSADGKMVMSRQLGNKDAHANYQLNTSQLASGNYMMILNTSTGSYTTPLIVSHR